MQFVLNLKPSEKKDDYTTTNHTGVNGPTGPITPKAYGLDGIYRNKYKIYSHIMINLTCR